MKLVSWNVNSLRSAEEKFLAFLADEKPEMVMIQEMRAKPHQLSMFLQFASNYKSFFNSAERPGYSGTAWYVRDDVKFDSLENIDFNDNNEGRLMRMIIGDTHIFNTYIPNGGMSEERLRFKMDFCTRFSALTQELLAEGKSVILGGDINVAHTELDLFNPLGNQKMSGFLPEERAWLSTFLDLGMVDTFRLFEKKGGHYSWWHMRDPQRLYNRGWRFDYFFVSNNLVGKVKSSVIRKDIFGSDHAPILLEIEL